MLPLEGSAAIIRVETCTGREFSVITVRVDCAGQSFQDDIFSNVTSSMISSHEDVFDMSNDDTCLYGGGVCDVEHGMPTECPDSVSILVVQVTFFLTPFRKVLLKTRL